MMTVVVLVTDAAMDAIAVVAGVVGLFGWQLVIFSCTSSCLYFIYYFSLFAFGFEIIEHDLEELIFDFACIKMSPLKPI